MSANTSEVCIALRKRPSLMTVAEVAALMRVSEATVRRYAERGLLPSLRLGHVIRIHPTALAKWIEGQQKQEPK